MKAASANWASLPATTRSRTRLICARSVRWLHARQGGGCAPQGPGCPIGDWRATVGRAWTGRCAMACNSASGRGVARENAYRWEPSSLTETVPGWPLAVAATTRFSIAHPRLMNRWWLSDRRRCRARQVRQDVDGIRTGDEAPWLGVVAVGRQRRIADEIPIRHARAKAPGSRSAYCAYALGLPPPVAMRPPCHRLPRRRCPLQSSTLRRPWQALSAVVGPSL